MTDYNLDEEGKMTILKMTGLGIVAVIGVVILHNYLRNKEYPELRKSDLIENQWVNLVDIDRGLCYVELQDGTKFRVWGQNHNYEDYPTIAGIISSRVLFAKNANSDSVTIRYLDKDYKYAIGQVIKKEM